MKLEYSSKIMRTSSGDISPWLSTPRRRASHSSGLRIASVENESRCTNGAETFASQRIGQAARRAMASA